MTSAPKSDSTVAAAGAAMKLAQSRTLRPSKIPLSIVASLRGVCCFCRDSRLLAASFTCHLAHLGGAMQLFPAGHQLCISAGCGCIDGHRLFGGEAGKVMRSAGLRPGARQAMAAE